jgi:hypothetical protein
LANEETIERFKPYYKILKSKMLERINVQFTERNLGDPELMPGDYLCIFYLVDDGKGNPGLTLDRDNTGEVMIIEDDEEATGTVRDEDGEVKEKVDITVVNQRRKKK